MPPTISEKKASSECAIVVSRCGRAEGARGSGSPATRGWQLEQGASTTQARRKGASIWRPRAQVGRRHARTRSHIVVRPWTALSESIKLTSGAIVVRAAPIARQRDKGRRRRRRDRPRTRPWRPAGAGGACQLAGQKECRRPARPKVCGGNLRKAQESELNSRNPRARGKSSSIQKGNQNANRAKGRSRLASKGCEQNF